MKIDIRMGRNLEIVKETTISIGRIKRVYKPSEAELNACPDTFTCFVCLEKRSKDHLGHRISSQWWCRYCRPYVDAYSINLLVKFDERRLVRHGSKKQAVRPESELPEDWEKLPVEDLVMLAMQGESTDGQWQVTIPADPNKNPEKHEKIIVKPSERQAESIANLIELASRWEKAYEKGFPGFPQNPSLKSLYRK
jgi:hypothetical protein